MSVNHLPTYLALDTNYNWNWNDAFKHEKTSFIVTGLSAFRVLHARQFRRFNTIDSDGRVAKADRVVGKPTVSLCMCWDVEEIPAYSSSHCLTKPFLVPVGEEDAINPVQRRE